MAKARISATLDDTLLEEFNSYCDKECINKSKLIEKLIRNYTKEKKGRRQDG